jgi:hypothetical protein
MVSWDESAFARPDIYPAPWGSSTRGSTDSYVRVTYMYQPHIANEPGLTVPRNAQGLMYDRLGKIPPDKMLAADLLRRNPAHRTGLNALYAGGSVQYHANRSVVAQVNAGLAVANHSDWDNFRRCINALERDINYADAQPIP